ncbi:hypothetical protein CFC21_019188 [Triticum aestivum]|uniref:CASP-like protein n=2 Tax=Triticum aestivum TaxID=4565 RepID=A0A9R1E5M6_WHEAT|nr:hypothetical protein CFC21_019188 [Triticum aestivum]
MVSCSYLNFASVLQFLWSLPLACLDIFSLRNEKDLQAPARLLLIVIIDWAVAVLMFSGVCAAACLTIFFMKDVNFCEGFSWLGCNQFALSVTLAFITWSLQAASSFSGLWLLVSFF